MKLVKLLKCLQAGSVYSQVLFGGRAAVLVCIYLGSALVEVQTEKTGHYLLSVSNFFYNDFIYFLADKNAEFNHTERERKKEGRGVN